LSYCRPLCDIIRKLSGWSSWPHVH